MAWDWDKLKEQQNHRNRERIPPQMDEILDRFRGTNFKGAWLIIVAVILALLAYSSFYIVNAQQEAVIQRFGKHVRTAVPGFHLKWPYPVETVTKVNVREYQTEVFEGAAEQVAAGDYTRDPDTANVTLMLTGDLNVAVVPWIVQYRVEDPVKFLFRVNDPIGTLRDLAESSMRQVVGDRNIDEIIIRREEIAKAAQERLQSELKEADTGILVKEITMKTTTVPGPVQPSFNEVNRARQEKEQMIYEAKEQYNKAIPAALGEADRTVKMSEGYALDRINRARGDAARFTSVLTEYKKAPEITRTRIYLESMHDILPRLGKTAVIDDKQKSLLPLLDLSGRGTVLPAAPPAAKAEAKK
ncbi:MAG: FtsH protease activity modulator HflK [Thermodesulfobacteriota bacterium]